MIESFVRELGWRDFWSRFAENNQNLLWNDVEDYKTGYASDDYQEELPEDILAGDTGVACIDSFIADLLNTGYVHNHARMYLASYIVHFRQIKWQAGARWFLVHLLDGDVAAITSLGSGLLVPLVISHIFLISKMSISILVELLTQPDQKIVF